MANKKNKLMQLLSIPEVISWRALMDTKKAIFAVLESCFQKEGYTVPRFQIMFYLYFEGPLSPTELSTLNHFTKGNTSSFLKRMTSDGLVKKVPGPSNGRPLYQLTDKAQREFEDLFPKHIKRVQKLMVPLEETLLKTLQQIRDKVANEQERVLQSVSTRDS